MSANLAIENFSMIREVNDLYADRHGGVPRIGGNVQGQGL